MRRTIHGFCGRARSLTVAPCALRRLRATVSRSVPASRKGRPRAFFTVCVRRARRPADSLDQRLVAAARRESACSSMARVSSESARARARHHGASMRAALASWACERLYLHWHLSRRFLGASLDTRLRCSVTHRNGRPRIRPSVFDAGRRPSRRRRGRPLCRGLR